MNMKNSKKKGESRKNGILKKLYFKVYYVGGLLKWINKI